jgi:RNA polymerase sigma factor (sigma-70 family)
MTDEYLLERFTTTKDGHAFRMLVERHGPMVVAVCRSILRNVHDEEDAFQNTFVSLALRAGTIEHSNCIGPWLHRVAVRTASKIRSDAQKRRLRERVKGEQTQDESLGPRDPFSDRLLRDEVSRLPDRYRKPLELCHLEGKTNEEAAAQLHCPVGTIKGRLWRARQTLKERLTRRGLGTCSAMS